MPGVTPLPYVIRPCSGMEEFESCVRLQRLIWGYGEGESYPARLLVNLTHIGGHVLGAFATTNGAQGTRGFRRGELVGFVLGMPAWRDGRRYLHSLSLAVAAGHENRGLGRMLKLEQRKLAIEAGVRWIEWTFDPMRAKNAFLNIVRLGAITRRYEPDYYGEVHSRLQQGLPSDRLVCEWRLNSARVRKALGELPAPSKKKPTAEIEIPLDFTSLAEQAPGRALRLQRSTRRKFEAFFGRGLAVTGFERGEKSGRYLLEPYDENRAH